MYNSDRSYQLPFQFEDFAAQLKVVVPEYREKLRVLYQLLSEMEYLRKLPHFLNATGPIVISGTAAERRGDPATRLDHVTAAIPFTDSASGVSLEFGISKLDKDWSAAISVQIRLSRGDNSIDSLLDLWEHSQLNKMGLTSADAVIRFDEDFTSGVTRVLEHASQLLRLCENILSGRIWPYRLSSCVQVADCDEFRREIEQQQNLGLVDRRGMTLLSHAIVAGRTDLVQILLQMGMDPNFACPETRVQPAYRVPGYAALHFLTTAIHLDSAQAIETAEVLLSFGADINQSSGEKSTPLGLASRMVWVDLVRFLLRSGARTLGEGWDTWATVAAGSAPSVDVRIIDQLLCSALGRATRLRSI